MAQRQKHLLRSATKTLDVLEYIANHPCSSFTDIVDALKIHKSTASRILATLKQKDFIKQHETMNTYEVGLKFMLFANAHALTSITNECISEILESLSLKVNENVIYSTLLDKTNTMFVVTEKTIPNHVTIKPLLFDSLSLHASSSGKSYLSTLSEKKLKRLMKNYSWAKYTKSTITSLSGLRKNLSAYHGKGYYLCANESANGLFDISVPILGKQKEFNGTISIIAPAIRATKSCINKWGTMLHASAKEITDRLI